ncbi:hypothetical protein JL475_37270 [Streptomyces sp. M2CJ-2]|uniref:hypothetical protein n=1 Tax=Streptomyces sp. M2CJ-2 TaxID=2803948 RepID=UPI00192846B9|nr:hypothetical protein [Streptomyces sp. M2CJ-2]MBL3671447.1 hypothetical protein [Streptomyces sp. M2CJ-2]
MNVMQGQFQFHAVCGHAMAVSAAQAGTYVRCPSCHQVTAVPQPAVPYAASIGPAVPVGSYRESVSLKVLYLAALLVGLTTAAVIYLVMFDDFAEEQLVGVTPLWFFPIVFGLYGFVSQRLIRHLVEGRAATVSDAARMAIEVGRFWAALVLFPFLVLKWRNSLLVSLVASLFWALLLWLFFALVFPQL